MITKIAQYFTRQMLKKELISSEDAEIYLFGLERMAEGAVSLLSILIVACLSGQVPEMVIFLIAFKTLREYAGGYHATTRFRCYFMTMGMIITVLSIEKYFIINSYVVLGIWLVCGIILFCLAPIEAENKPLEKEEKILYGKKAKFIWCVQTICLVIGIYTQCRIVYENLALANICVAAALITEKWKLEIIKRINRTTV